MEEALVIGGGHEELPQVPMGEPGLAGPRPLRRDGSTHPLTVTVIGGVLSER